MKWEYIETIYSSGSGKVKELERLGNEGWEIAAITQILNGGGGIGERSIQASYLLYTWKRPIQTIIEE